MFSVPTAGDACRRVFTAGKIMPAAWGLEPPAGWLLALVRSHQSGWGGGVVVGLSTQFPDAAHPLAKAERIFTLAPF
jgi:hypothetical protein